MTNIAEILKYCPQGMKLYSPICGDCTFYRLDNKNKSYPIVVEACIDNESTPIHLTKEGLYLNGCLNSECLLFPSKNQRNWSKFKIPVKRGDIVMFRDKSAVFIVKELSNGSVETIVEYSKLFGLRFNTSIYIDCIPASEDMKEKLFKAIDDAGYKWDGENLVKKEHQFKPFDKVLVRDNNDASWKIDIYSHYTDDNYPFTTITNSYKQCIPFKGNEHLIGTSNSPR